MGARVRLVDPVALPATFDFQRLPSGQVMSVRLVWQHGTLAGLRFT